MFGGQPARMQPSSTGRSIFGAPSAPQQQGGGPSVPSPNPFSFGSASSTPASTSSAFGGGFARKPPEATQRAVSPVVSDTFSRPPSPTSLLGSETPVPGTLLIGSLEESRGPATRHKSMYFESMIIFKAGNTLFKVPRFGLPEEGVFSDMFTLPEVEGTVDGTSDDNPIVLPSQVTAHDFQSLLKACHPLVRHGDSRLVLQEWLAVAKVSTIWCMDKLRANAIARSEELFPANYPPVERLLVGRELRVSGWMIRAYEELGRRLALLNAQERELLGTTRSFKVMELRERSMRWAEKRQGRSRTQYDFRRKVKQLFAADLARDKDYRP
ncbi:unnamed protein product [Peniophora sp. CBMAI 1063]|nr:unnamed protein product [Peniophora sp. CBMAI 1063]